MAVPNLSRALRGWTTNRTVNIVTKDFPDGELVETTTTVTLPINIQPMPAAQVSRRPEGQQTWSWWSLRIRDRTTLLKTDDIVVVPLGSTVSNFRVEKAYDWRESGFTKYDVIQDYEDGTP